MTAVITETLVSVAQQLRTTGHGERSEICKQAAEQLGVSLSTFYRQLKQYTATSRATRKQRADAGQSALTLDEAKLLSGVVMESSRANNKRLYALEDAVDALRANGLILAADVNQATGEIKPLSVSAISRALYAYGLHPEQLSQPDPHTSMRSLHPNHVWQIDASLCVLYYLRPTAKANGLHVMPHDEFYKNKPRNLQSIMADRVWSYEIVDHASGWIYVEYVMGAESGINLTSVLINALQERGGADVMHGIPKILYMDPGSANTSAMALNLCRALGIQAIAHAAGNARATGSVEKARDIIERKFESGLRFRPVADLAELNALAAEWRAVFNATAKHRRHGQNRSAVWLTIRADQLIKAPSVEVCRELATASPEERKVSSALQVSFQGDKYSVADVPGVMVGQKVLITRNPWRDDSAQVIARDEDGHETIYVIPRIVRNDIGFDVSDPVFGESYARPAATDAQKAKAAIEQIMTATDTPAEAESARKAKTIPLQGKFNPYKSTEDANLPEYMPRRGTEHGLRTPTVVAETLTVLQIAKALRNNMADRWVPEHFKWLQKHYPQGAKEDELPVIEQQLRNPRPALKVVGGKE